MIAEVPYIEPYLARYDLEIYLRRPAYGMNYIIGKLQAEQENLLALGWIPASLARREMTGLDDEVKPLW